jgi:hypothetical protein
LLLLRWWNNSFLWHRRYVLTVKQNMNKPLIYIFFWDFPEFSHATPLFMRDFDKN